jgi:hypothetical protein
MYQYEAVKVVGGPVGFLLQSVGSIIWLLLAGSRWRLEFLKPSLVLDLFFSFLAVLIMTNSSLASKKTLVILSKRLMARVQHFSSPLTNSL